MANNKQVTNSLPTAEDITINQYFFSSKAENSCTHPQLLRTGDNNLVCLDCNASTRSDNITQATKRLLIEAAKEKGRLIPVRIELGSLYKLLYLIGGEKQPREEILSKIDEVKEFEQKPYCYMDAEKADKEVRSIDSYLESVNPDDDEKVDPLQERKYKLLLLSGTSIERLLRSNKGQVEGKRGIANAVYSLMTTDPKKIKKEFGLSETPRKYLGTTNDAINKSICRVLELKRTNS